MTLQQHIKESLLTERIHITSKTKGWVQPQPTSKEQLQSIIKEELERQGPDAPI